ncbi:hypothetical protein TWF481_007884 [Arthrobotrys musiformis]|uniref:F-box domain-containing protein n=1 Tax=Arthrobotrys musiformis TaxID=47236 RepID=A0AAV9W5I8_9PEZI
MASLITLVRAPEILDEILQYLSDTEVLTLASTCKPLYPLCSRYIWATLRVKKSLYSSPGRVICPKFRILPVIEDYWTNSNWIQYTRCIVLGCVMNRYSNENKAIMELLTTKKLYPNCIDFEIFQRTMDSGIDTLEGSLVALSPLKKYSESRSAQEFSILLESNVVYGLPGLVDLSKVTKLTLGLVIQPMDEYPVAEGVDDLIAVLAECVNLTYFSWEGDSRSKRCKISKILDSLSQLQDVVTNLRRLTGLRIYRYLFHPSFFLVPPDSVRTLSLDCIVSEEWWQSFASCPLPAVEVLSINHVPRCDSLDGLRGFGGNEFPKFDTIVLGDVAVRSLRKFSCDRTSSNVPQNLMECMLKRNPRLDLQSRQQMKSQEAINLLKECAQLYDREYRACLEVTVTHYVKKFVKGFEVDEQQTLDFMAEWAEMLPLIVQAEPLAVLRDWMNEKERAEGIWEDSDQGDSQHFAEEMIQKARNFVVPLVYEFSGALRGVKGRAVDALALRLAEGENVAMKVIMVMLAEDALVRIRNVRQGIRDFS